MTEENIQIIEDDNFLDKDVSELVVGDFYLFYIDKNKHFYFYRDNVVYTGMVTKEGVEKCSHMVYKSGTLNEFIKNLEMKL
jgi:uncharacterized protein YfaT (DUF1175 family)